MPKSANISPLNAAQAASSISSERERLLQADQTGGCTRRANTDNDRYSTRCQVCGRNDVELPSKQKYGRINSFSPWFPETDPKNPRAQTWSKKLSHRSTSLFIQIVISTTVLLSNISVAIYAMAKYGTFNGFEDVYKGDCTLVSRYNSLAHIVINVASTLLLGSSNYCAQLLVAPTREEVDMAHGKGDWLDIGAPSLRNLWKKRIAPKRKAAWSVLMISSVLLHLVWNSAVFSARPFSSYQIALVTSDYLADAGPWPTQNNQTLQMLRDTESLLHMNKTQCIESYASPNPGQKDVLVVAANFTMQDHGSVAGGNTSSSLLCELSNFNTGSDWIWAQSWLCSAFAQRGGRPRSWCTVDFLLPKEIDWTLNEGSNDGSIWMKVDYCLSAGVESLDGFCALRYSAGILLVVCILNLGKCIAIYYTAYLHYRSDPRLKDQDSLVTIGDAAASFLKDKDPTTDHLFFASREEFTKRKWPAKRSPWTNSGPSLESIRWFRAASYTRWLVTLALCVAVLVIVSVLLAKGIDAERVHNVTVSIRSLFSQGLGTAEPYAVALTGLERKVSQVTGFYVGILFANLWQVIYSALYLLYNGLLTTMLVADEWNDFIKERKTLRLSNPRGIQRSSYFLSLPYRFAIPLMVASATLHWLISQSVFVIETIALAYGTDFYRYPAYDASLIGYSNIGVIYSLIVGFLMVVALVTLGLCNSYRPREPDVQHETDAQCYTMPLVSTCSAAISAACHGPKEDSESYLLPVRWGFVEGVYWCFTTSRDLSYPKLGLGSEPQASTETSGSKEIPSELRIDLGPAFEVPYQSQQVPSRDAGSIGEDEGEIDDRSALLLGSPAGA